MTSRAVVITISDRCSAGTSEDRSGPAIIERLADLDASLIHREIIPDERERIEGVVRQWIDRCELIVTSGGTGVALRDVTPEAILPLIEKPLPGFGEIMRTSVFERIPLSIVSRSGAGVAGRTLILWLGGSQSAAEDGLRILTPAIKHVCAFLRGAAPH